MLRVAEIVAREPFHRRARQEIAFRVFRARGKARIFLRVREISGDIGRIDEQLRGAIDPRVATGDRPMRANVLTPDRLKSFSKRLSVLSMGDVLTLVGKQRQTPG
jgi:hypothetical protein